jgi:hypothetical protein
VDGDLSGGGSHGRFGAEGPKKAVAPAVISVASLGDNWPAAQAVKTGDGQSFVGSAHRRALALLESSRESFDAAVPALRAFKTGEGDLDHIDIILEALFDRENINQLANYLGPWSRYSRHETGNCRCSRGSVPPRRSRRSRHRASQRMPRPRAPMRR